MQRMCNGPAKVEKPRRPEFCELYRAYKKKGAFRELASS